MKCDTDCFDRVDATTSQAQAVLICLISNDNFKLISDELLSETLSAVLLTRAGEQLREAWEAEK